MVKFWKFKHPFYKTKKGRHIIFRVRMFVVLAAASGLIWAWFGLVPDVGDPMLMFFLFLASLIMTLVNLQDGEIGELKHDFNAVT